MRRTFSLAIIVLGILLVARSTRANTSSTSDDADIQMQLKFSGNGFGTGNGSCSLGPGHDCEGIVWGGSSTGMSIGSIVRTNPVTGPELQMIYSFSYSEENGTPMLDGVIYSIDLAGDRTRVSGQRKEIHEPIEFDQPHRVRFTSANSDNYLEMEYTLIGSSVASVVSYGSNTITLKSFNRRDPSRTSVSQTVDMVSGRSRKSTLFGKADVDPINFSTEFVDQEQTGRTLGLTYQVAISFDPPLDPARYPQRSVLKFTRMYLVDSSYQAGTPMTTNWITGYTFSKALEIAPGKVLKYVFPANLNNPTGFEIEDTVIIVP